ncbi:RNA polymerase sigma factor [Luteolibacter luteus]|uniref:Sigma-70 family RNA polymerase sigma factor n=1 Tax=Luteolibacter luteus TaxID=2728835 RepID=A0A858RKH5_9BACT|nr:sigma-70 family RNA polymerase sigma factor [Luteolibacter luteus]QJE97806.1 sigma-70 family RNA polymerase sigma factor [Luteolibacter luteus]
MSAPSDASLLRDWTIGESEEAFAILARRYAGLLYHAALRRTGREDLASEAAQNSLLILARKASRLTDLPSLSGWLHRTACYEAAKLLRRERRHEDRMKNLPAPDGPDESETAWQEAGPLLDQALDGLSEKDREVIFLRYFDGLSFEQMARQFGGESAAWRQRGSRALERLRVSLTKRGVAVSSGTLAMGLSTTLSQAAPASVLAAVSVSPAAGAAALSSYSLVGHSLHFMKLHPATWIVVALLLSAVPLSLQAVANASARNRIASLESSLSEGSERALVGTTQSKTSVVARSARANLLILADLIRADELGATLKGAEANRRLKSMSEEELEQLLTEAVTIDLHPDRRNKLINRLFLAYISERTPKVSPERVVATAGMLADRLGTEGQEGLWGWAVRVAPDWAKTDPEKALAWYREGIESGRLASLKVAPMMASAIYRGLYSEHREQADAFYHSLCEEERVGVIQSRGGLGEAEDFLAMAFEIRDPGKRREALLPMFQYETKGKSIAEVMEWVEQAGGRASALELLAAAAEGDPYREDGGIRFYQGMKSDDIAGRIDWLREPGSGDQSSAAIGAFLARTISSSPDATKENLDAEWERNPDEAMLAAYISRAGTTAVGAADALQRIKLLGDPDLRSGVLHDLLESPGAGEAIDLLRKSGLTSRELEELQLPTEIFE